MHIVLEGKGIRSESDFHHALARSLDFGPYYGFNLAALRDRLSKDVERPIAIEWRDSNFSREAMGLDTFRAIVDLLHEVEKEDLVYGWEERFKILMR